MEDRDTAGELIQTGVGMVLLEHILFEGHTKNPGGSVVTRKLVIGVWSLGERSWAMTGQHLSSEGGSIHGGKGGWDLSAKLRKCKKIRQKGPK